MDCMRHAHLTVVLCAQVQAVPRMMATRTVALIPTVTLAVLFEATNTFDTVHLSPFLRLQKLSSS